VSDEYTAADFATLSSSAENFAIVAGAVNKELDELEGSLQSKLSSWDGEARDAYWQFKAQWEAAAADMQKVIQRLGLAIGSAHENYVAAEKYGVNLFS
jgi:6 kDa early secretory antigenic target